MTDQDVPASGDTVVLENGVATKLATDEVIEALSEVFSLRITASERDALKGQLAAADAAWAQAQDLLRLAEEIRRKADDGTFRFVTRDEEYSRGPGEAPGVAERALYDLEQATRQGARFVWCDDRFVNGFANFESAQILGVSEMLGILRMRHRCSKGQHYEVLSRLRAANCRFLPVTAEEILWCLERATLSEECLTEATELTTLRRYVASCLLDVPHMKKPVPGPAGGSLMEFRWPFETSSAVTEAIGSVWANDSISESGREIMADYLLHRFFWPLFAVFEIADQEQSHEDRVKADAGAIAGLLVRGFGLPWAEKGEHEARRHRRAKYNDWVATRLLVRVADIEPGLIKQLARIEAESLCDLRERDDYDERTIQTCLARAIFDLPEILKEHIEFESGFRIWLGIKRGGLQASISGVVCDGRDLWRVVARAGRGQGGRLRAKEGEKELVFVRLAEWSPWKRLGIEGEGLPLGQRFKADALPVAVLAGEDLERMLRRRPDWFDLPIDQRAKAIRRISEERDPARRVEIFLDIRAKSVEWLYSSAAQRFRCRTSVTTDDLIAASLEAMGAHLRLTRRELEGGMINFDAAAVRLIAGVGLARAAQRLVHLPIPLPESLLGAMRDSDPRQRALVLARLERTVRHPLAMIQAAHLCMIAGKDDPGVVARGVKLVRRAVENEQGLRAWGLFESVLNWAFSVFGSFERFRGASIHSRLLFSWLHAGRLTDVCLANNVSIERAEKLFEQAGRIFGIELGAWDAEIWEDCMHPRFAQRCPVLLAALASVIDRLSPELGDNLRVESIFGLGSEGGDDSSCALLLRDSSLCRNKMDSFLGGEARSDIRNAITSDLAGRLQPLNPVELREDILQRLEETTADRSNWNLLTIVINDLPIPGDAENTLQRLIESDSFEGLLRSASDGGMAILRFVASRIRLLKDDAALSRVHRLVDEQLQRLVGQSDTASLRRDATNLAACFLGLSIIKGDERETYQQFHRHLGKMVRIIPESGAIFDNPYWSWPNRWSMNRQAGFWNFEMSRRSVR